LVLVKYASGFKYSSRSLLARTAAEIAGDAVGRQLACNDMIASKCENRVGDIFRGFVEGFSMLKIPIVTLHYKFLNRQL